jgi:hypothetical protein
MLEFLRGKASHRKVRLFAVACCARHPDLTALAPLRRALRLAELFADGLIGGRKVSRSIWDQRWGELRPITHALLIGGATPHGVDQISPACMSRYEDSAEPESQARLLRELFGFLPFRSINISSDLLTWNDSIVRRIAQGIYDERLMPERTLSNGRLAILHDALLDAGCDNEDLLIHCREPGPHVRGCWAIDLLLAKK